MYANTRLFLFIGMLIAPLCACHPTELPPEGLAAYINNPSNGVSQTQRIGQTQVSVTYQPPDLLVMRELQNGSISLRAVDSLRGKYSHSIYFLLSIAHNGREVLQPKEGFAQYSDLLQTLSFHMDQHVCLITSRGDTLRPVNYYLDRTYAAGRASQLLFAFTEVPSTGTWQFYLLECGLQTGSVSFAFDTEAIRKVPAMTIH